MRDCQKKIFKVDRSKLKNIKYKSLLANKLERDFITEERSKMLHDIRMWNEHLNIEHRDWSIDLFEENSNPIIEEKFSIKKNLA